MWCLSFGGERVRVLLLFFFFSNRVVGGGGDDSVVSVLDGSDDGVAWFGYLVGS